MAAKRRKKRSPWGTVGKVALGYGVFCIVNSTLDWVGGQMNDGGGATGWWYGLNAAVMPLNVLSYLGGGGLSGLGRTYKGVRIGTDHTGRPIYQVGP
jgi:hypothetical protein